MYSVQQMYITNQTPLSHTFRNTFNTLFLQIEDMNQDN